MFFSVLFDIILVCMLLAGGFFGYTNGFVVTVARPVKFVLKLVIAFSLAGVIGSFIIEPIIGPAITHKLSDVLISEYSDITATTANDKLPTLVRIAAGMCGVSVQDVATKADGVAVIEAISEAVCAPVVEVMGLILGFIIAYFLSQFIVEFIMEFIDALMNSGVTVTVNKTLGCAFSLMLAFVSCWVFTTFFEFVFNIPAVAASKGVSTFEGGPFYSFFKSFTPLDLLLSF